MPKLKVLYVNLQFDNDYFINMQDKKVVGHSADEQCTGSAIPLPPYTFTINLLYNINVVTHCNNKQAGIVSQKHVHRQVSGMVST